MKQIDIKLIQLLDLLEFETQLRVVVWGSDMNSDPVRFFHTEVFKGKYLGNDELKQYENHRVIDFNCSFNKININISDSEVKE